MVTTRDFATAGDWSPWRPAHVHFLLAEPGYQKLVTHLFPAGTEYLDTDVVFGVKEALITPDYYKRQNLAVRTDIVTQEQLTTNGFWAGRLFWYFVVLLWPVLYWQVYG